MLVDDELGLAALAFQRQHGQPGGVGGDGRAVVAADQVPAEVQPCGGSLILGATGLLNGYRATTHWSGIDVLALFGAENAEVRVVVDRNRITGGGVTAGLDFGLAVLAQLLGEDAAKLTQLMLEYAPAPPFDAGTPATAGPQLTAMARAGSEPANKAMTAVAEELATRGWGRGA